MNTIRSIVSIRSYRIPPRLKLLSTRLGSLILLFQRMPVVQFLFPEANIIGGASVANTISLAVTTVVGLTTYDAIAGDTTTDAVLPLAVTGATTSRTSVANGINVPAAVSVALDFKFKCDTAPSSPESWKITTGTLPAGLAMDHTTSVPVDPNTADPVDFPTITYNNIKGTPGPATAGIYPVQIRVYRDVGQTGDNITQLFNICVLGFSPQPAASTTINSGQTVTLTCTAQGFPIATTLHNVTPTVTYQWYQGDFEADTAILGASGTLNKDARTASYTTPNNLSGTTNYWVKVTSVFSGKTVSANSTAATVNVNPASNPFDTWASTSGLPVDQRGATQTPQNDGVTNLMKYACNLNPMAPDVSKLTVGGSETKGLPVQSMVGGKLRMEFLRRKASPNPGITYFVEFSSDMGGASWSSQNVSTSPAGSPVGTEWERVVFDDPTGGTARFGRVKVVKSP